MNLTVEEGEGLESTKVLIEILDLHIHTLGVEPKIGGVYPPKWMVKIMENPIKNG